MVLEGILTLLLVTIQRVEQAGLTNVSVLDDCPPSLYGFYLRADNQIGLCRNTHDSETALIQTLLHEAVHRMQHCRDGEQRILQQEQNRQALEDEALEIAHAQPQDDANNIEQVMTQLQQFCSNSKRSPRPRNATRPRSNQQ